MIHYIRDKRGFFTFLGIVFALAIVCFLFYIVLKTYFKAPFSNEKINSSLVDQGIDTTSYQRIEETTREKIHDINQKRINELEDIEKQLVK